MKTLEEVRNADHWGATEREAALISRAKEIQDGYGCSRSTDSLHIALAEELVNSGLAEILTFDAGLINQAAKNAPSVKVNLLQV